jgi:hypothetical protein
MVWFSGKINSLLKNQETSAEIPLKSQKEVLKTKKISQ